ncbi:DUF1320 family protein [Psychrobacter sp. APC 3279]|uniref:phage protein Gp36 family protein n=1 Tax=Psychrobacter sp. APC 3279 TaxID=3035189 RepID=UPI0025B62008|nr:phage protein Gp36 family protein [Psychrobacter sp. APC 3279]MDN3441079.1 DUF1320 family protein [Psychrobacter sp. APC 3279]
MNPVYCTPIDLIAYANQARLLSQIASADYGQVPTAEEVLEYFQTGVATPDKAVSLQQVKDRVEQVISNSASEINGLLALCGDITLPAATLTTINMDLAMARLFESLADDSQIKRQADRWVAWFDKIATGKIPTNKPDAPVQAPSLGAETASTDLVFSEDTLNGY